MYVFSSGEEGYASLRQDRYGPLPLPTVVPYAPSGLDCALACRDEKQSVHVVFFHRADCFFLLSLT